ncbi:MAG: bifunctional [glutamate--ammonia ligase]-adenylyl-L-tyrosine phosphorylase/[glutamate--ammonia-ligase] adenylyltransferase [Planctomycetota bacterium]|jgi:glutamate-ammonia-ligase adenylyltransferase
MNPRDAKLEAGLIRRWAADPDAVSVALARIREAGADPSAHREGWIRLLDVSPGSVEQLVNRPALIEEIPRSRGTYERDRFEKDLDEALVAAGDLDAQLRHLRAVRVEETLRIAWQDVVEAADLTVVTRRISDLAEIVLERVVRGVRAELAHKYGRPWHDGEPVDIAIIAMGKLGGGELNYSSDIDLIFLYGKDGETDGGPDGRVITNREFFHRMTERVTREVNDRTPQGRMYRVDLRLRPEGAVGSLVRTLASTLAYYRRLGETWERQAHLKARAIAGDRGLGEEFVRAIREWSYGRGLSFKEIAALKRIKQRIEDVTAGRGDERHEVKLGYGGIRDVEFVIQFMQLLHGARIAEVRHPNSLIALRLLEKHHVILPQERDALDDAYRFLRVVEHRLMLVQGAQVHRLPSDKAGMRRLARRCGFADAAAFEAAYREQAEAVRAIFNSLFRELFKERDAQQVKETELILHRVPGGEPEDRDAAGGDSADGDLEEVLAAHGVRDTTASARVIDDLAKGTSVWLAASPRTREFLADLFPRLLDAVARTPDPDAALRRFERITAQVGAPATLYQAMGADDLLLNVLVELAGSSLFLTNILATRPGTLDQLMDALASGSERGLDSFEDIPTATVPQAPDPARILSDFKNLELLRIGLRDVRGNAGVRQVAEELTRLATVIVRLAHERARREAGAAGGDLVVVALGSLGARELLYGSDLDLVYFARDGAPRDGAAAVARRLAALLATPTDYGRLYDVDPRLRPGGTAGPLVTTPTGFANYFASSVGETWERMAYTRARPVAGPPTLCEEVAEAIHRAIYVDGFKPEAADAAAAMRERLAAAGGADSIKRGHSGGVVDIEFIAQMLALRHGRDHPNLRTGNVLETLQALDRERLMPAQEAADLGVAYSFLLALELKIRIVTDLREDRLPAEEQALATLARRLGYADTSLMSASDALREEYDYHRHVAAREFQRVIRALGGRVAGD